MSAVGFALVSFMGVLLLALPRRHAVAPVLVLVCYMTLGEHVIVGGLNFTMMRVILLFGWMRIIARGELRGFQWNTVDKLILAWTMIRTINYTLVWGGSSALINRLGYAYDILGAYFLFRCLVREPEDIYRAIRYLALFVGPLALLMFQERLTGRNFFAVVGGVPLSEIRDGVFRAQGPFSHSILAGTFGASTLPLFIGGYLFKRKGILLTVIACASATVITAVSGSSGPALAYLAGLVGLMLWPLRRKMRLVRWTIVVVLLALQVIMSQPVWFIMARLTVVSGSTGWFRGFLVDMTLRHFSEWWLIGSNANASWHYYLADVTNQYIAEALGGGLITVMLFIAIFAYAFRSVGRQVLSNTSSAGERYLAWSLGAVLFLHLLNFVSVTYFDQNVITFYLLLAGISVTYSRSSGTEQRSTQTSVVTELDSPQYQFSDYSQ
jgi:hypothetical protein